MASLLLAALYALLLAMVGPRLPTVAVWGLAALAAYDLFLSLRRAMRALARVRRPGWRGPATARQARPLPMPWALYQGWLLLAVGALAWRLFYLGMPFLPFVLPAGDELAWGVGLGAAGAAALALLTRLGQRPRLRLRLEGWRDLAVMAVASGLAGELALRAAVQQGWGWLPASALGAAAYLALAWRMGAPAWGPVLAGACLGLGWVFDWSGNLWGPAIGHAMIAAAALAAAGSAPGRP